MVQSRAQLPLSSVSGAAHGAGGFLVTGAGQQAGGPAVARVDASTGRRPATVHCATLAALGLTTKEVVELNTAVWSVQAVAAGAGLDVLCRTPEGAILVRTGESAPEPSFYPGESGLFPGVVIAPRDGDRADVWTTATAEHHEVVLPTLSAEGPARVATPMITTDPDLLVWATQVPGSRSVDAGASTARTISAQGWVAPLDPLAWQVGPAAALPTAAVAVAILGGGLFVADSSSSGSGHLSGEVQHPFIHSCRSPTSPLPGITRALTGDRSPEPWRDDVPARHPPWRLGQSVESGLGPRAVLASHLGVRPASGDRLGIRLAGRDRRGDLRVMGSTVFQRPTVRR